MLHRDRQYFSSSQARLRFPLSFEPRFEFKLPSPTSIMNYIQPLNEEVVPTYSHIPKDLEAQDSSKMAQ